MKSAQPSLGHSLRLANSNAPLRALVSLPRPGTAFFLSLFLVTSAQALPERTLTLTSPDGTIQKNLTIEIAADAESRRTGLMYRSFLKPDAGMLFTYPTYGTIGMWMRNTLIPLDMLFIHGQEVVHIHPNAIPHDETPITSGEEVNAVLEVNGGYAAKHHITPGWRVSY